MQNSIRQLADKVQKFKNSKFITSTFHFSLFTFHLHKGQSIVELLVAIGLSAILLPALLTGLISARGGRVQQLERLTAVSYVRQAEEIVRSVRDGGWTSFAANGTFHPQISGLSWTLAQGEEALGDFTRRIVVSDVYRDTNGTIVTVGGVIDPSTKRIDISVSWSALFPTEITSTLYLTRYRDNLTYTETTQTQFNAGTKTAVAVVPTSSSIPDDGEIILGAGGRGDWCNPGGPVATLNLTGQGIARALTAIEGRAFVGTGQNASGYALYNVTVSNANPPVPQEVGTYDDSGLKTNGVFGESHYAYLATDKNSEEVVILDVAPSTPVKVGTVDTSGPTDANSVFVEGTILYVTTEAKLYTYDITNRASPQYRDDIALPGIGNKIFVVNGYAYVALASPIVQMQIINAQNPADLQLAGQIQVNSANGQDVYVKTDGSRAYLVTSISSVQEFFIINTENKNSLSVVGSYEANGMDPKGVTIVPGNRALIVGSGGEEYQAVSITTEGSPVRCGGLNNTSTDNGVNGIASVLEEDGDAYSYITTGDAGSEFQIIEGGPGGKSATEGMFESATLDLSNLGNKTAFNRIDTTWNEPGGTDIRFQVASAEAPVGGNCSSVGFTFVGPNGDTNAFFQDDAAIPLGSFGGNFKNPGHCFRYKAYFSTNDPSSTPTFYDMTVNYSP